jgi:cytochrome P450
MDPKANEDPERLDLQRHPNRHLAFGTGIHFCLGYQLARIEGKCALEALFGRWPKLSLAIQPADIRWRKRPGLRAIEKLPVVARRLHQRECNHDKLEAIAYVIVNA